MMQNNWKEFLVPTKFKVILTITLFFILFIILPFVSPLNVILIPFLMPTYWLCGILFFGKPISPGASIGGSREFLRNLGICNWVLPLLTILIVSYLLSTLIAYWYLKSKKLNKKVFKRN